MPGDGALDESEIMAVAAPAIPSQVRMWQLQHEMPDRQFLHISTSVRVRGPLDVDALRGALTALTARHEALRSRFALRGAVLHQVVDDDVPAPLRLHGPTPGADPLAGLRAAVAEPLDLRRSPLWRMDLLVLGDDEAVLALHVHHSVIDGQGMLRLLSDLDVLYRAARDGTADGLDPAPSWMGDLRERNAHFASPGHEADLAYWRGVAGEVPVPARLPGSRRPGVVPRGIGCSTPDRTLPPPVTDGLRALGRRHRATLTMVVTACVALALSRFTGSPTISLATAFAGRRWAGSDGTLGMSACTLPIVFHRGPGVPLAELVTDARDQLLTAMTDTAVSFEDLQISDPYWPEIYHAVLDVIEGALPRSGLRLAGTETEQIDLGTQERGRHARRDLPAPGLVARAPRVRTRRAGAAEDPYSFDVSVAEVLGPLVCGATLVVAPPDLHRDPAGLAALVVAERITVVHVVPSMLSLFLDEPSAADCAGLRLVMTSGEALTTALAGRALSTLDVELVNLYGPTEAAGEVTSTVVTPGRPVTIGRPMPGVLTYVLDEQGAPVPVGVVGELYLAGPQLARGDVGDPDATADRFPPSPVGPPGARVYRTGDLVRWTADRQIEYCGRVDDQVKVGGIRVEPGEIAEVVGAHPGVSQAKVVASRTAAGVSLAVYVVPAERGTGDLAGAVRAWVAERLPRHMRPAHCVVVDSLPLTRNGKVDVSALPPLPGPADDDRPPTGTERALAAIFQTVLERPVGVHEDFFTSGGTSLAAIRVVRMVRHDRYRPMTVRDLFDAPTARELARVVDEAGREARP